ncbi:Major facilitator superfamily domain-containing protein 1 [Lepeophtheirus salmonis]|uniref:Major facilitator superfamily domain-containing protein 1 n=1 Tax=Lepeophtheirus salmonis TaxID=72036 RepID=A0A7R8CCJ7_LEPSM|nr:Major facilitator superfamily domain-containing protein 1 [Lepeophtheirus salmonis]CAF2769482.1 Major facilitator superfamily domain-containing protein 1 [Lepeophtheirus salmonis]
MTLFYNLTFDFDIQPDSADLELEIQCFSVRGTWGKDSCEETFIKSGSWDQVLPIKWSTLEHPTLTLFGSCLANKSYTMRDDIPHSTFVYHDWIGEVEDPLRKLQVNVIHILNKISMKVSRIVRNELMSVEDKLLGSFLTSFLFLIKTSIIRVFEIIKMRRVENNEESRPLLSSATNDTPPFYDSTVASNPSHNIRDDELELEGCAGSCCCHPTALCHRLIALALMCFLGFGSYFCYDNPGALQNEIRSTMGINTYKFAELYAWYSWPNTILPIIGGYLMDRIFVGAFTGNFPLMQFGRFVFGIGGESLAVAQNSYAVAWFKGKELNMVFGFQISITRVGSTVNFLAVGPLFHWLARNLHGDNQTALGWTFSIAGITCIMSLTCALILGWMDKRAECLLKSNSQEQEELLLFFMKNMDLIRMTLISSQA